MGLRVLNIDDHDLLDAFLTGSVQYVCACVCFLCEGRVCMHMSVQMSIHMFIRLHKAYTQSLPTMLEDTPKVELISPAKSSVPDPSQESTVILSGHPCPTPCLDFGLSLP